jgi:predicted amidohydrolase
MRTDEGVRCFEEFARQCECFIDVASDYKCDFILFPELLTTQLLSSIHAEGPGIAVRRRAEFTPQSLELFSNLELKYEFNIVSGTHYTVEDDRLFNVVYRFKRNGGIGKQYEFYVAPNEPRWWGVDAGNKIEVFETDRGKISIQNCYDVEFPEVSLIAVEERAQIIFVPFCTDEGVAGR